MAARMVKTGVKNYLTAVLKTAGTPEDKEVFLFSNNFTIADGTVNASLTPITTAGGQKQTLTKALWATATAANPSVCRYYGTTGVAFAFTGTLAVYGYGIRGVTSLDLIGAENFGLKNYVNGQNLKLNPLELKLNIPA